MIISILNRTRYYRTFITEGVLKDQTETVLISFISLYVIQRKEKKRSEEIGSPITSQS